MCKCYAQSNGIILATIHISANIPVATMLTLFSLLLISIHSLRFIYLLIHSFLYENQLQREESEHPCTDNHNDQGYARVAKGMELPLGLPR